MPTDRELEQAAHETRTLIRRFQTLSDALAQSGYSANQGVSAYNRSSDWISSLWRHLRSEESRKAARDKGWDAFTEYLVGSLGELTTSMTRIARRTTTNAPELIVCCILNAIYEALGEETQEKITEIRVEHLEERAYLAWLHAIRELLVLVRDLNNHGLFEFGLGILSMDLSARIRRALEEAFLGPLVAAIYAIELGVDQALTDASRWLAKTRCTPIIELWGAVLSWLYTHQGGFIRKSRGFAMKVMLRMHRTLIGIGMWTGAQIDGALGTEREDYTTAHVELLIKVIDELIRSVRFLRTCRLPYTFSDETPSDTDDPLARDPRGPTDRGDGRRERDSSDGGDGSGNDSGDGSGNGSGNGSGSDTSTGGRTTTTTSTGNELDPATTGESASQEQARRRYRVPELPDGYVYLTTSNITELLIRRFNVNPDRATDVVAQRRCREELSPETRALLADLGI